MPSKRNILTLVCFTAVCLVLMAQGRKPKEASVFRLVSADRAEQTEIGSLSYRIVKGNARFLHNETYLLCDSASWNVTARTIEAFGHVRVVQDETMLTSDEMLYLIDEDLARFSGPLVELTDKDGNRLRTRKLDYNTKDSTAVFDRGAAMKNKDGNVIESVRGRYEANQKTFTFENQVNVFIDTMFLKTDRMIYYSKDDKAVFGANTHGWMDDGFVHSSAGFYDRKDSVLNFSGDVYMKDPDYEAWAGDVYYYRPSAVVEMFDNVRILDTVNQMVLFGNHARYEQDSSRAMMTREPAVVYYGENENHEIDTLFLRSDTVMFWTTPMCDFSKEEIEAAAKHREDALFDAIQEIRTKQAEERAKQIEEKMRAAGKLPPIIDSTASPAPADSTAAPADSAVARAAAALDKARMKDDEPPVDEPQNPSDNPPAPSDSTVTSSTVKDPAVTDTTALTDAVPDSTRVKRLRAWHNAKVYRTDVQFCCDSLEFSELDSIAVLFGRPILWNKVRNQLTSETMHLLFKDGEMHRGSMLTDARITSMEDSLHFNQIRSTEMMGFFEENQLVRYDALGGVSAVFYMQKDHQISNVNIKQAKSLTAVIENANAKKMLYIEEIKSDAYPLHQIEMDKQRLKGFEWRPDERPVSRYDITDMQMPQSARDVYDSENRPSYSQTDQYFDKYMRKIYNKLRDEELERFNRQQEELRIKDSIAATDSLAVLETPAIDELPDLPADSLAANPDSLVAAPDTVETSIPDRPLIVAPDEVRLKDTLVAVKEDTAAAVDSSSDKKLTRAEKRALRKLEREQRRAERKALREQRRAERKAAREAAKAEKAAAKAAAKAEREAKKKARLEQAGSSDSE
ncbi:MAG: hypothetical protein IJU69_06685 [Bacteroidales bacterium]|nr:hypothetical protein [Bacteroidales bacterium]